MGPVQSTLLFFPGDRDGIGVTASPNDHSRVHNHKTLVLYILLVQTTKNNNFNNILLSAVFSNKNKCY